MDICYAREVGGCDTAGWDRGKADMRLVEEGYGLCELLGFRRKDEGGHKISPNGGNV